jgi:hypothetical protein
MIQDHDYSSIQAHVQENAIIESICPSLTVDPSIKRLIFPIFFEIGFHKLEPAFELLALIRIFINGS